MHLAIVGPFDIENYGDHIFRKILEYQITIRSRHTPTSYDIYSLVDGPLGFRENKERVYSIDTIESRHKDKKYDAVIIAGGSVIHFEVLSQYLASRQISYPIWKLWVQSSCFADKYGVKLLWNSPEAPLEFKGWEPIAVRKLLKPADYLSVRDTASRSSLAQYTEKRITVTPDTAFLIQNIYKKDTLPALLPSIIHTTPGYIVYHCNQRLSDSDLEHISTQLMRISNATNLTIILLPLAYTNNEIEALKKLNQYTENTFVLLEQRLMLDEIVAVIASSRLYVGLSFHGAITAHCFSVPCIAFDYEKRRKTKQLYDTISRSSFYADDAAKLEQAVTLFLKHPNLLKEQNMKSFTRPLEKHFDHMWSIMSGDHYRNPNLNADNNTAIYDMIAYETSQRTATRTEIQKLSDGYKAAYTAYLEVLERQTASE